MWVEATIGINARIDDEANVQCTAQDTVNDAEAAMQAANEDLSSMIGMFNEAQSAQTYLEESLDSLYIQSMDKLAILDLANAAEFQDLLARIEANEQWLRDHP